MSLNVKQLVDNPGQIRELSKEDIQKLIFDAQTILDKEPKVVRFNGSKILFVGDTHGDLESTIPIVRYFLRGAYDGVIFLGDYVDRGLMQIENINYLLALKLLHPEKVILLRGNHETPLANLYFGFLDEVSITLSTEFYSLYAELFSHLPYSSLVNREILCLHGGLAKDLNTIKEIEYLPKEVDVSTPTLFQILWNDPRDDITGFVPSDRGPNTFYFGKDVYENFAENNNLTHLVRGHEVFRNGFHWYFGGSVLSLFSASNYVMPTNAKVAELNREGELTVIPI